MPSSRKSNSSGSLEPVFLVLNEENVSRDKDCAIAFAESPLFSISSPKAAMLSEQMYGPNHACTVSFQERLAAFGEEMEKRGLSANAMAQSLSLLTFSSLSTRNTGSSEPDELDFLEDGMLWGQPPKSLMAFA